MIGVASMAVDTRRMRRILLTVHKFFPNHRAGTEVLTLKVAQELQRRGYDILVVTANPPDLDARHPVGEESADYVYEGVPVHVVGEPLRLKGYTFQHEYLHPGIGAHFDRILEKYGPDLVHVFHAQNLSASIIDAARRRGIPVIASTTDFWFVCPIVQLKRPDGAICRGPSKLALNCLSCYTPRLFPPISEFTEALQKRYSVLVKLMAALPVPLPELAMKTLYATYKAGKLSSAIEATISRPDVLRDAANKLAAIMVPTRLMRDIFVENGVRAELIHHIPFGLDTQPLVPFQQKTASEILRVGFIGTIYEHKGVDLLIEAFQTLPPDAQATLTIYGDLNQFPDYGARMRALAERPCPHSKNISFGGTFPNSKLGEVLSTIDLLVVPSRWYENTPLVIQSALAAKTPLIVTNLGGMSELVKHEVNGLLFQLNDSSSLREQLLRVLNEPALLQRFRDNIAPERTTSEMVDDIVEVYGRVLPARKSDRHGCLVPAQVRGTIAAAKPDPSRDMIHNPMGE